MHTHIYMYVYIPIRCCGGGGLCGLHKRKQTLGVGFEQGMGPPGHHYYIVFFKKNFQIKNWKSSLSLFEWCLQGKGKRASVGFELLGHPFHCLHPHPKKKALKGKLERFKPKDNGTKWEKARQLGVWWWCWSWPACNTLCFKLWLISQVHTRLTRRRYHRVL